MPAGVAVDVLDDILASLRLTGGVVVDAQMHDDWCLVSQFTAEHCAAYFPVPGTLIAYHYVREGELWAEVEGHPPTHLRAGSVLILPRNDRHLLYTRPGLPEVDATPFSSPVETTGRRRSASTAAARRSIFFAASSEFPNTGTRWSTPCRRCWSSTQSRRSRVGRKFDALSIGQSVTGNRCAPC